MDSLNVIKPISELEHLVLNQVDCASPLKLIQILGVKVAFQKFKLLKLHEHLSLVFEDVLEVDPLLDQAVLPDLGDRFDSF